MPRTFLTSPQKWNHDSEAEDAVRALCGMCNAALPELTWANWQLLEPIVKDLSTHVRSVCFHVCAPLCAPV